MKKEDLVAKGLNEEQAQAVLDIYAEEMKGFIPKHRFDEVNAKLKESTSTLEKLKESNADNDKLQKELEEHKQKIAKLEYDIAKGAKESTIKEALRSQGVKDVDYLIYKQGGIDKFNIKDGSIEGLDDIIKPLKESSPYLFTGAVGGYNPKGGAGGGLVNPFAKDTWNLTEQGKLFRENPEQARELANSVGIKI